MGQAHIGVTVGHVTRLAYNLAQLRFDEMFLLLVVEVVLLDFLDLGLQLLDGLGVALIFLDADLDLLLSLLVP